MIGLCFEGETPCDACGKPVMMNALVEKFICSECLAVNKMSVDEWKNLLEDVFKTAPTFQENEGQPSTIIGGRTFKIMYGRQNPKFRDTKSYIEMDKAMTIGNGKVLNPQSQVAYSIRPIPENFKEACPGVTHLLCEDFTMLPTHEGEASVLDNPHQKELVPFSCPNCAGTLQLSANMSRTLKCQFCSTESFIPDETWQKMHPVKQKERFYFWYDDSSVKFEWDSEVYDGVADQDGTLYMSLKPIFSSNDDLWIVALNPDMTQKWRRDKLNFKTRTGGGEAKLGLNANGELMVWSWDRNTMMLLSTKDGSEIRRIGKKNEGNDKLTPTVFDFTLTRYISAHPDGSYFVHAIKEIDGKSSGHCEFIRLDKDANILPAWGDASSKKGFFGSLKKMISGMGDVPYFDKLNDQPTRVNEYDILITTGPDGSYYLREHDEIIKLDKQGNIVYYLKIEGGYSRYKMVGDKDGNAYYLKSLDGKDSSVLMKISPDGKSHLPFIRSVLDGGKLADEEMLALGGGHFYCFGYGGCMRIFDMNGNLIYVSKDSLEDEEDIMDKKAEMED